MNKLQSRILIVVAVFATAMMIWPPTIRGQYATKYQWLFAMDGYTRIDTAQLITQWVFLIIVGGIGCLLAKDWRPAIHHPSPPRPTIVPPRGAWTRSAPWFLSGFLVGFASSGHTLIADFGQRVGAGLALGVASSLVASAYYAIKKPDDYGNGNWKTAILRFVVVILVVAAIGIVTAIAIPAYQRFTRVDGVGGRVVYDNEPKWWEKDLIAPKTSTEDPKPPGEKN